MPVNTLRARLRIGHHQAVEIGAVEKPRRIKDRRRGHPKPHLQIDGDADGAVRRKDDVRRRGAGHRASVVYAPNQAQLLRTAFGS